MNQNNNKSQPTQLKLDDKNAQFFVNLVSDFVYNFNSNPAQYQSGNSPDSSLKIVLTGDMAGNIYKTVKKIPLKLTMMLVGSDISINNFLQILKNMKNTFFDKIKEDDERDDYCWLVQFDEIFNAVLHQTHPEANQQNKSKTHPKISFKIIKEYKKNHPNSNQQPQPNTSTHNKKHQLKSGINLVIESDKMYELPFLEIETATEFHSIQIYPNLFIPNQFGANIGPDDELSCAVLLKLHTYERNKEWIGLKKYIKYRKEHNHPKLPQNNSNKT